MRDQSVPIVELHQISKRFPGVQALDAVNLKIFPGQVHAILGENGAGKTTLINVLVGELQPDDGEIIYEGERVEISSPHRSRQLGISVVYQELALCLNLSVAENIALNTVSNKSALSFVNRRKFQALAREALSRLGLDNVDLRQTVGQLSVAQQQLVEIAKAISMKVKVLVLDEPNSALTIEETERLFQVVRQLRHENVAIVFISHRLEEVLQIADWITVLRDGKYIDTLPVEEATIDGLISRMVGRNISLSARTARPESGAERSAFEVRDLSSADAITGVSFHVRKGEIVGFAGLPDSGKDELVDCLFGLRACSGRFFVNDGPVTITSPSAAIAHGLALIPADRRGTGSLLVMSVQNNTVVSILRDVSRFGFLNRPAMTSITEEYVNKLDIRIARLSQKMGTLSGGNQQKVILARGLAIQPSVLILHEPTRGIDVGAKAEIYAILQNLAAQGVAIIVVSSELPELIGQCDRIYAMHDGRITGHFVHTDATEEKILACAMGQATALDAFSSLDRRSS